MARGEGRSAARLAAVQALYQMDVSGREVSESLAEFETHWIGQEIEGAQYKPAETTFFRDVVRGVLKDQIAIDRGVDAALAEGWPLKRIESVMRAILRAGNFEIRHRADIPARVIVSEYCDVAGAFFEREDVGVVNGVLDKLARQARLNEFGAV